MIFEECLGSVVASCVVVLWLDGCRCIGGRVMLSSLLADFAVCASQGRNSNSTGAKTTRGDARWPVETVAATGKRFLMLL
ncbi:hypothetical protein T440DRAFT_473433 [Plenodomus tracheiphilus IPT5]|uniref:Uncharacterized protein n=1 Tax=Plenodomus tracheiphilus IPT5 TaxID=1408161 RepID=A0A6A7APW7_9PLEO|nr:hypothetical protein T440DRAFT_473433 [Plenodomus tracheiphilus IPT5]